MRGGGHTETTGTAGGPGSRAIGGECREPNGGVHAAVVSCVWQKCCNRGSGRSIQEQRGVCVWGAFDMRLYTLAECCWVQGRALQQ
jgi:hypothetical protein